MMTDSKHKLTPWFENGEKPARPGVYEVTLVAKNHKGRSYGSLNSGWFSYWNGKNFSHSRSDPKRAFSSRGTAEIFDLRVARWRGLAEPAK